MPRIPLALPILLGLLVAAPAQAASLPGAFTAGMTAPLVQLLHLAGLLGLGLWSCAQGRGAAGQGVAVALAAAILFAILVRLGFGIPYVRLVLEASLVVFGGMVALSMALPVALGVVLAAVAGAAHGVALAGWAGATSSPLLFWPGMFVGGLLTLSAGVGLWAGLSELASVGAVRGLGVVIAVIGVLMLAGVI